jgi:hypothetical protein
VAITPVNPDRFPVRSELHHPLVQILHVVVHIAEAHYFSDDIAEVFVGVGVVLGVVVDTFVGVVVADTFVGVVVVVDTFVGVVVVEVVSVYVGVVLAYVADIVGVVVGC